MKSVQRLGKPVVEIGEARKVKSDSEAREVKSESEVCGKFVVMNRGK